jgi:hypothetical protein
MQKCRSLTTPSLIFAFAIGAAALSAQPANASDRFSEAWALGLARFESTLDRTWFRLSSMVRTPIQPAEGAVLVPGGKEGAILVPGGKEGAILVPGGIAAPSYSRPSTSHVERDQSY